MSLKKRHNQAETQKRREIVVPKVVMMKVESRRRCSSRKDPSAAYGVRIYKELGSATKLRRSTDFGPKRASGCNASKLQSNTCQRFHSYHVFCPHI